MAALLALTTGASGRAVSTERYPWAATLHHPGSFALIRHATARGTNGPPDFRLDECATQRNLSAEGRARARIGELLRANGIAAAEIHSSQRCRRLDAVTLMKLGDVRPQPLLNSFFQDRAREAGRPARGSRTAPDRLSDGGPAPGGRRLL